MIIFRPFMAALAALIMTACASMPQTRLHPIFYALYANTAIVCGLISG